MKAKFMSVLLACIVLAGTVDATTVRFGNALKERKITFDVKPGGDLYRNMAVEIKSSSNEPIRVELEAGRVFEPENAGVQPYVVTRPAVVALNPQESKTIYLYARCGNSKNRCPGSKDEFPGTRMGSAEMVATLNEMNRFRVTDPSFYQNVVWHYTNGNSISALNGADADPQVRKAIVDGICLRENKANAKYSKTYKPAASGNDMEFSGVVDKIFTNMNIVLEEPADLKVALLDEHGETVKIIGYFMQQPVGQFTLPIELLPEGYQQGTYSITLTDQNNKTLDQLPIQI